MRRNSNKIALIFAILFFVIAVPMKAQEAQVIDKIVAVVGQNIILQSDVEAQYLEYRLHGGGTR